MGASKHQFKRRQKLVKPKEFQWVFQTRCKSTDKALVVLARQNGSVSPRLGLAISIKHARNAVIRNRIKRVVRESFRQRQATLGGLDYVVTGRTDMGKRSNQELRVALDKHWQVLIRCKKS